MFAVGTNNETNRYKWTEETLKKIPTGYKILDAGAGECQFKKFCTHLNYTAQDFAALDESLVLMTEKDAVKCESLAGPNAWYLQIDALLPGAAVAAVLQLVRS